MLSISFAKGDLMASWRQDRIVRAVMALCVAAAAIALPSCNTVNGFGQDIQAVGGFVSGGAETVQQDVFE